MKSKSNDFSPFFYHYRENLKKNKKRITIVEIEKMKIFKSSYLWGLSKKITVSGGVNKCSEGDFRDFEIVNVFFLRTFGFPMGKTRFFAFYQ